MATKPSSKPEWMTGITGPEVVEPSAGKKADGWNADERPPREFFNWLFQNISDWIDYLDEVGDFLAGYGEIYRAIVGTQDICTHATLAAALADSSVVPGDKILVLEDQIVNTTVQVTKNFIEIEFHKRASFIKGTASTGLQISALNCKITGGRFQNWTTAAILIDAASKNCMLRDITFVTNTVEVTDNSTNTSIVGCITEE